MRRRRFWVTVAALPIVLALMAPSCTAAAEAKHWQDTTHWATVEQQYFRAISDCMYEMFVLNPPRYTYRCQQLGSSDAFAAIQYLDWSSDGCSGIPDNTWWYDFTAACRQHDFCWRNMIWLERVWDANYWHDGNRDWCDSRFWDNTTWWCANRSGALGPLCLQSASYAYLAVNTIPLDFTV